MTLPRAQNPFLFSTRINLIELTGLKARNLQELLEVLKSAPSSIIYHHTHHFLKQHQALSPEPPNDFSYWVTTVLKEDEAFHFMKSLSFILPTPYKAEDLAEFGDAVMKISPNALYHHIFEARLRLEKGMNDFSSWLDKELGEKDLANAIARLDPYTQTMESLRQQIHRLISNRLEPVALEGALRA